jgi:SAM-dependent methyltransferase
VGGVGHVLHMGQRYAYGNAREIQRERLRTLETLLDAGSRRALEPFVAAESRCLEVGAGGGSIAAWLADRAAEVVATDLDVTVLQELDHPNVTVRVHDVLADDLPDAAFDLIHLRLVLAWLTDVPRALERLVGALAPGGVLVAEEMDFGSVAPDPRHAGAEVFARVAAAHDVVLAERHDFDPYYGRCLEADLAAAGLAEVGSEGRAATWTGAGPGGDIWRLTLVQLRDEMDVPGEDIDRVLELCDDPTFRSVSPVVMAAWGQRQLRH